MSGNNNHESDEAPDALVPYINQRLSFEHLRCTVRYIGPVAGTSGSWLGVEWDDPDHGKHNGAHAGVRYFTCRSSSEHAASFIRSTRGLRQDRVAFLDAVQDRYVPARSRLAHRFGGTADPIRFGIKVVEEVGFDRIVAQQSELQKIRIVGVERMCIVDVSLSSDAATRAESERQIADTLTKVDELDLSANLIERWTHVAEIVRNIKRLKTVKLSGNRFADLEANELAAYQSAFEHISELWLEDTLPKWDDVTTLVAQFYQLKQLYLGWNELTSIPTPLVASNLRELNLAHNKFTTLSSLSPLASLPALTSLALEGNLITDLTSPPTFPRLISLDLASNQLPRFTALNPLATSAFPVLTSLRLSRNPFMTAVSADVAHMLALSRLPQVSRLDYGSISAAERTNAELYYLSRIAAELTETTRDSEDERHVLAEHPQWLALCAKHEFQPPSQRAGDEPPPTFAPGTLGARLITLHISTIHQSGGTMKTQSLKVPRTISIYALKSAVGRAFDILPARFRLVWETGEWDPVGGRGDEDEFSVESDDDDGDGEEDAKRAPESGAGRFVRREVEIVEGTSSVGFWIDGAEATVRLEKVGIPP